MKSNVQFTRIKLNSNLDLVHLTKEGTGVLSNWAKAWRKALSLATVLLALACDAKAASQCEEFDYGDRPVMLSVPEEYYAFPRSPDSMISLKLRYRDLSAPQGFNDRYDPQELGRPDWSIDRSNSTSLLQVYRHLLIWPTSLRDLQERNPRGAEIVSDWNGWTKFKPCTSCYTGIYISDHWQTLGVAFVECFELRGWDPLSQQCFAHEQIDNLLVKYSFPSTKREHLAEFRERIRKIINAWIIAGSRDCHLGDN